MQDALAAEYVTGALTGAARRRYEKLERSLPSMARKRQAWERRLSPLSESLTPVQPSPAVHRRLARSIAGASGAAAPGWLQRLGFWRGLTAVFATALLALGTLYSLQQPGTVYVAVIGATPAEPQWFLRADFAAGELRVQALADIEIAPDKSYQLWMLPGGGADPVSLGLLPLRDERVVNPGQASMQILRASGAVAVSLEPAGGSPEPVPTGPVVYVAALISS